MHLKILGILVLVIVGVGMLRLLPLHQAEPEIHVQAQAEPEIPLQVQAPVEIPTPLVVTPQKITPPKPPVAAEPEKPKPFLVTEKNARAELLAAQAATPLNPNIVRLALTAYEKAHSQKLVNKPMLTVIDYSKKSIEKRLWVFDLNTNELLIETYVTHGEGSGKKRARRFSNKEGTHRTSIGVFTTAETYRGVYGYALRLDGHEEGFNDQARKRAIVIHGADYVNEGYIEKHGRLGTSFACPAVDDAIAQQLIDTIKEGSLVLAFYPNKKWLKSSAFLDIE